jgi:hypothetical protein
MILIALLFDLLLKYMLLLLTCPACVTYYGFSLN